MLRADWPLHLNRPRIQVVLTIALSGQQVLRNLLADTGAGHARAGFELLLEENDCLLCGGQPARQVTLSGAYSGVFPAYFIQVQIPLLGFDEILTAIGAPAAPTGFDGIGCFELLNRFTYGNFGNPTQFGLET